MTPDLDAPTGPLWVIAAILWATLGIVVWRIYRADRRERIANDHVNADEPRGPRVHDGADGRASVAAERLATPDARAAGADSARLAGGIRRDPGRGDGRELRSGHDHRRVGGQALLTDDELVALARYLDLEMGRVEISPRLHDVGAVLSAEQKIRHAASKIERAASEDRPDVSNVMRVRWDR